MIGILYINCTSSVSIIFYTFPLSFPFCAPARYRSSFRPLWRNNWFVHVHTCTCIHCTCISLLHNVWIDTWPFDYHILHTALTEVGIFRLPGQASRIHTLKETYDCGSQKDFSTTEDIHTVASLLKLYLRELPEPVIPHVYYESFKQATRCEKLGKKLALYMYKIGWLYSLMNYVLFTRNLKQYRLSGSSSIMLAWRIQCLKH